MSANRSFKNMVHSVQFCRLCLCVRLGWQMIDGTCLRDLGRMWATQRQRPTRPTDGRGGGPASLAFTRVSGNPEGNQRERAEPEGPQHFEFPEVSRGARGCLVLHSCSILATLEFP